MSYKLILKRSAEKELLALPKAQAFKVKAAIVELGENPRPKGCKKMSGARMTTVSESATIVSSIRLAMPRSRFGSSKSGIGRMCIVEAGPMKLHGIKKVLTRGGGELADSDADLCGLKNPFQSQ